MSIFKIFKRKHEKTDANVKDIRNINHTEQEIKKEEVKTDSKLKSYEFNVEVKNNSPMHKLWTFYQSAIGKDEPFRPIDYIKDTIIDARTTDIETDENGKDVQDKNEKELTKFIQSIQKRCEEILVKTKDEKAINEFVANAEPILYITHDMVRLWAVVLPPFNGGKHITSEMIKEKMELESVSYGILNETIDKIVSDRMYLKIIEIAVGKEPVNGTDGYVENLFSKNRNKINIKEDHNGNVNYKELNMIQSVHKDDTICKITLPTDAIDGINVKGEPVKGKAGKYPFVPNGKNTAINDDKTRLVATIDGEVVYEDNKFSIKSVLNINHDVDNSSGNINFAGDVIIKGDVREGYTVKADGDVTISGTVEGATIITGGNLVIERGMTGGNKGVIEAQGTLKCRYLENCHVYAKMGIQADQIMYSTLSTDESIVIKGKKGSVTGGKLVAGCSIEAVTIGTFSNSHLKTEVVLGVVPHLVEQEKSIEAELESVSNKHHKLSQDINYIESKKNNLTPEREALFKRLKLQYQMYEIQKIKLENQLKEVKEQIHNNTEKCSLYCKNVYPVLSLNVCGSMHVIDKELTECRVSRKNDMTYVTSPVLAEAIMF